MDGRKNGNEVLRQAMLAIKRKEAEMNFRREKSRSLLLLTG
jgi:hypothetical protein